MSQIYRLFFDLPGHWVLEWSLVAIHVLPRGASTGERMFRAQSWLPRDGCSHRIHGVMNFMCSVGGYRCVAAKPRWDVAEPIHGGVYFYVPRHLPQGAQ